MSRASVAIEIAERIHRLRYEDLPAATVAQAKRLILDTLVVAGAGADADGGEGLRAMALAEGGRGDSTIWGTQERVPATAATLVNTYAGAALDFDSLHQSVHPDSIALAAALAVGEREHADGRAVITAFVAGSELICRLARASVGPSKGWTYTAVYGVFGAAAIAAKLGGLDATAMANSFGLALSLAAGSQQTNVEQVLAKRLQPALAARNGVFAAALSSAGISAPAQVFEGRFGLWSLYQPADREALLDGFGSRFVIEETGLKKYPICACSHAAVDSLVHIVRLVRERGLAVGDIARIEARISPFMDRLVGGAFEPETDPQVVAQFSLRYALAAMLLRGRIGIAEIQPAAVRDPAIRAITDRITVTIDPANSGELAPATLIVRLRDGTEIRHTQPGMPGDFENPLGDAEFRAKLEDCARWGTPPSGSERLAVLEQAVDRIESCADVNDFVEQLRIPQSRRSESP